MRTKCNWVTKKFALNYLNISDETLKKLIENKKITYRETGGPSLLKTDVVAMKIILIYTERKLKNII